MNRRDTTRVAKLYSAFAIAACARQAADQPDSPIAEEALPTIMEGYWSAASALARTRAVCLVDLRRKAEAIMELLRYEACDGIPDPVIGLCRSVASDIGELVEL